MHPTEPFSNEKLSLLDDMSVHKYFSKMCMCCDCSRNLRLMRKCKIKRIFFGKDQAKIRVDKPDTMADVPSTDSNSEINDSFNGLSSASQHLGEGALLYLQTMKTLAFLFLCLTIINAPLLFMYSNSTNSIEYGDSTSTMQYMTIGNIAKPNHLCEYTRLDFTDEAGEVI